MSAPVPFRKPSKTGATLLFPLASGAVLYGISRLPHWLAGVLAIIVLVAGTGLLGWLHIAPGYRVGIVGGMTELSQEHVFFRLTSPFDRTAVPVVAPYELSSVSDVTAGEWVIARGTARTATGGQEVFEVSGLYDIPLTIPAEWTATARKHMPVPPAFLGVIAAGLCLLFFWGVAGLSAAAAVAAAAMVLTWHGAAILGFEGTVLLPQPVHLLITAFAAMVGFRLARGASWQVREGLGRVMATTALSVAMPFIGSTFGWPEGSTFGWPEALGWLLVMASLYWVVITPVLIASWLLVLSLAPQGPVAVYSILAIVAVFGIALQSLPQGRDPRVPVVTGPRGLRRGEMTGRIPLESLIR